MATHILLSDSSQKGEFQIMMNILSILQLYRIFEDLNNMESRLERRQI